MKKKLIFAAAAIAMLASCSQNDLEAPVVGQAQQSDAIEFGTYLGKQATSRTGWAGNITTTELKEAGKANGFGVFAYYTNADNYAYTAVTTDGTTGQTTWTANFMYNQHVTWNTTRATEGGYISNWTYSPIKYWPNDIANNGAVDAQTTAATGSVAGGKLTFFAYAPYVETPEANSVGINSFTANSTASDPIVGYKLAANGAEAVDLLWGTFNTASPGVTVATNEGVSYDAGGTNYQQSILPSYTMNADLTKQKTSGKVDFAFKHALAKLGGKEGLKIQLDLDNERGAVTGGTKEDATKVTINSITISTKYKSAVAGDNKYYQTDMTGNFNLANGHWQITSTQGTDASAATMTYIINRDGTGTNVAGKLHANIAEPESWNGTWASNPAGVLVAQGNVYADDGEAVPLVLIPGTYPELTVTVDYIVRTADAKLQDGYSQVRQVITKKLIFANAVELNKYYKLLIHLGLTSVKFDATVSDWDAAAGDAVDIHVPLNVVP